MDSKKLSSLPLLCLATIACLTAPASAEPRSAMDPVVADVTTRAFSLVWAVDEPVTGATAKVFADAAGTSEITQSISLATTSATVTGAHALGLARVDVSGLAPGTCYYAEAEITSSSGSVGAPFLEACTAVETRTTDESQRPINNDLLILEIEDPAGSGPLEGGLVLVEVPGLGAHPLSAFVGDGSPTAALIDLNNLFEPGAARSTNVQSGALLRVVAMRGLACPDPEHGQLVRMRRVPDHEAGVSVTGAARPAGCFSVADPLCDDVVDLADAQWVINIFGSRAGSCEFHSDLDLVADGVINILDIQSILNRFGETAPAMPPGGGQ